MTARLKPTRLRRGDTIGIAAPASPVRPEYLDAGSRLLAELGFRLRRAPHLLERRRYTAGSREQRAADLRTLLVDPEVRAIWAARGGFGSPHLIPLLDPELLRQDPKLVIGASDITALLLWTLRAGVTCLHGPMPAQEMARRRVDVAELDRHLTQPVAFGPMTAPRARPLHPGRASGTLTGGCLSLVVSSLGTPWEIDTEQALLFLEDADTKPYQIDRMLTQLRQAGKLSTVTGILFGEMPRCQQTPDQGYTLDELLADLTVDLGVPVAIGFPCGHTEAIHRPLPLGVLATLDADTATLTLDEAVVSPTPAG